MQDQQQHHRTNECCENDARQSAKRRGDAELTEDPAAHERADDTDDDVTDKPNAANEQ